MYHFVENLKGNYISIKVFYFTSMWPLAASMTNFCIRFDFVSTRINLETSIGNYADFPMLNKTMIHKTSRQKGQKVSHRVKTSQFILDTFPYARFGYFVILTIIDNKNMLHPSK